MITFIAVLAVISVGTFLGITWTRHQPVAGPTSPATSAVSTAAEPSPTTEPSTIAELSPSAGQPTPGPSTPGPSRTAPSLPPRTTGPPGVPANLLGKDVERIPTSRPVVALTFDAGANGDGLASILATLAAQHVPGTFFLTGQFATSYPAAVRSIVAGGHRIGNHSMTHPYFTRKSDAEIRVELTGAYSAIRAAGGSDPRLPFRFPFGDRNARTIAAVNANGYACIRWTVDTLGWQGTRAGITVQRIVDRVLAGAGPGEIVLMHIGSHPDDHSTLDADALPTVIAQLRAHGYSFVTLDALL